MGDCEAVTLVAVESPLKYHSVRIGCLTSDHDLVQGQCLVGSLTGAVASQRVTEAFKGWLGSDGNRTDSANAEASLTVRLTSRTDTKVGLSDPAVT